MKMTTSRQDEAFITDVLPGSLLEDAIAWIANNLFPEDVFSDVILSEWAEGNGFEKVKA